MKRIQKSRLWTKSTDSNLCFGLTWKKNNFIFSEFMNKGKKNHKKKTPKNLSLQRYEKKWRKNAFLLFLRMQRQDFLKNSWKQSKLTWKIIYQNCFPLLIVFKILRPFYSIFDSKILLSHHKEFFSSSKKIWKIWRFRFLSVFEEDFEPNNYFSSLVEKEEKSSIGKKINWNRLFSFFWSFQVNKEIFEVFFNFFSKWFWQNSWDWIFN